jgi:hypothetical protein
MRKNITWVGIDDHKLCLTVAVLNGSRRQEPEIQSVENEDRSPRRWVKKLLRQAEGGEIRMCYEAGPNGFGLKRRLEGMGPVMVEVVAPTLTPRRVGRRVKTTRSMPASWCSCFAPESWWRWVASAWPGNGRWR